MSISVKNNVFSMLTPKMRKVIFNLGYREPTPIQEKAIPVILQKRSTLVISPTGSGKTEAALIPILDTLIKDKVSPEGIRVLYITPLRALNRDVFLRMENLVKLAGYTMMVRHGDTGKSGRKRFLEQPPTVMVTTPESLSYLLTVKKLREAWKRLRWIVIDEIHEVASSKRGVSLAISLERLARIAGRQAPKVGLSATLSERGKRYVQNLIGGFASVVEDNSYKKYNIIIEVPGSNEKYLQDAIRLITHYAERTNGNILIFVNTRQVAELLGHHLAKRLGEEIVGVHHGSLHKSQREKTETLFRSGKKRILVATSSMELGIDIGKIDLVIQFTSPRRASNLIQRVGRAGHKLQATSEGVIIVPPNLYEILESLVLARRSLGGDLEDLPFYEKSYDAAVHGIAGLLLDEKNPVDIMEIHSLLTRIPNYTNLSPEETVDLAEFMDSIKTARIEGGRLRRTRRTYKYFYTVSMIPDDIDYDVIDASSNQLIGKISEKFVALNITEEQPYFVLSGKIWRAVEIDGEKGKIYAYPHGDSNAAVPSWEGELIPVHYKTAREVCALLSFLITDGSQAFQRIAKAYNRFMSKNTLETLKRLADELHSDPRIQSLGWKTPLIEIIDGGVILYTCLGSKGNLTLGILLSALAQLPSPVEFVRIPYAIVFMSNSDPRLLASSIKKGLEKLSTMEPGDILSLLIGVIRNTSSYKIRFNWVAKRMGVIEPEARLSHEMLKRAISVYRGTPVDTEAVRETLIETNDAHAVIEYVSNLKPKHIQIIDGRGKTTPLAREVLSNPYMRMPETATGRRAILQALIVDAVKKRLLRTESRLICLLCGHTWTIRTPTKNTKIRCPKCGRGFVAPVWRGDTESVSIARKALRGEKLTPRERKLYDELRQRANLLLSYSSDGKAGYVIQALSARGIGPRAAIRVMRVLMQQGEQAFYKAIMEEEKRYLETRKYWKTPRNR
ncbi:MAG: DEAD/DEAH box helicase [Desulfurococcales archaeon]|nr:DEAD/DEAH box helicase [Desulfurococcales archaeon]